MRITWYGHSAFGIEAADGTLIVTDPYDPEKAGFKPYPDAADVVVKSSSTDDYHDNDHLVPKKPGAAVIDALELARDGGRIETHGISVRAIEAMEHDDHPSGHSLSEPKGCLGYLHGSNGFGERFLIHLGGPRSAGWSAR